MDRENVDRVIESYRVLFPPLITVQEAAQLARHDTDSTIYDWSSRGLLDHFKSRRGRRVLLERDAFIRFLVTHDESPHVHRTK